MGAGPRRRVRTGQFAPGRPRPGAGRRTPAAQRAGKGWVRVWAVVVGFLLVAGGTGPVAAEPVTARDLVGQVASVFDEAWVRGTLSVPRTWPVTMSTSWHEVPDHPGVFALAATMAEDVPARMLLSTVTPVAGTWMALLDGGDHQVKWAVELPARDGWLFQPVTDVAGGDVLLFVDTTGVWPGTPSRVWWLAAGVHPEDLPQVHVDDPGPDPVAPILGPVSPQFLAQRSSAWMALAADTPEGRMVTFTPNLNPACPACWPYVEVRTPAGGYVAQAELTRDQPSVTFPAGPGQLIQVVTRASNVNDPVTGTYPPVVVHPRVVTASTVPHPPVTRGGHAYGPATVRVNWSAPDWQGASPVTSYTATATPGGASCTAPAEATTCDITVPDARVAHTVTVTARNAHGVSPASAATSPLVYRGDLPAPVAVPSAPRSVVATQSGWDTVVTWSAPASAGGAPISGYQVTIGSGTLTVAGSARSTRLWGTNGHRAVTHTIQVAAVNRDGYGEDQVGPVTSTTVRTKPVVSAEITDRYADKLFVNVTPNRSTGYWRFRVERRTRAGAWVRVGTYRTYGVTQTRTLNLPRGTYRVRTLDRYGYVGVLTGDTRYLVR